MEAHWLVPSCPHTPNSSILTGWALAAIYTWEVTERLIYVVLLLSSSPSPLGTHPATSSILEEGRGRHEAAPTQGRQRGLWEVN